MEYPECSSVELSPYLYTCTSAPVLRWRCSGLLVSFFRQFHLANYPALFSVLEIDLNPVCLSVKHRELAAGVQLLHRIESIGSADEYRHVIGGANSGPWWRLHGGAFQHPSY